MHAEQRDSDLNLGVQSSVYCHVRDEAFVAFIFKSSKFPLLLHLTHFGNLTAFQLEREPPVFAFQEFLPSVVKL